ncbi:MAG: hypothetical protein AAGH74_01175 [Pseudomonadota bacterium]
MRPDLRASEQDLRSGWVAPWPEALQQTVSSIKISTSSRFFLTGALFLSYPDKDRAGRVRHGKLAFKLVAGRSFFGLRKRYVIHHFVSAMTPKTLRRHYSGPFLRTVLAWLRTRGFHEVRFPIHSRRRRAAFQDVITGLGFEYRLLNRLLFQVVVVDLKPSDGG